MRAKLLGLLGVILVAVSCGSPSLSPSASATTGSPSASSSPAVTQGAGATPTSTTAASPSVAAEGDWAVTSPMALGRGAPHAVLLGDGRVLVAGNDEEYSCGVRPDSAQTETWDPASGTWSAGPSLNAPRGEFAAVPVGGVGVLVTGGVTAGDTEDGSQSNHQSYSSTYVFDPASVVPVWSRQGLLDRARTLPIAATLLDGRVLVAGGYYLSGEGFGSADGVVLAAYHAPRDGASSESAPPGDMAPPGLAPTFATAELFDPVAGSWSGTGPMRYARVAAPAATLTDGRVLVAGSGSSWVQWNFTRPSVSERAQETAEIFDPRTGRFALTGDLPALDWSPLAAWGGPYPVDSGGVSDAGALVALADGGALLVGQVTSWSIRALGVDGSTVRTLRYDAAADGWTLIDQRISGRAYSADGTAPEEVIVDGHSRSPAIAARLHDGRVLVVQEGGLTTELYDPASGSWSAVTPMPAPRAGGAAVLLRDGSVLVVGGPGKNPDDEKLACNQDGTCRCGEESTGLANAIRFIPAP
jgi:hypothetical protein